MIDAILRQSTAVTIKSKTFRDRTDAVTAETALTLQKADVRLAKNGGNMAAASADQGVADAGAAHDELGKYDLDLDATDTATLGVLDLCIDDSAALPINMTFMVVPANIWDSWFSTDKQQVDVAQWNGTNVATPATAGYPAVTIKSGTGTGEINLASGVADANLTQMGGVAQSATDLKDFADAGYDPATNKVEGVKLVDTTTTNTDMRGTDSANTTTPPTVAQIRTEMDSNSAQLAAIVEDTGTTIPAQITALNDLDATEVQTAAAAALTAYDPPTKTELDSGLAALNDLDATAVQTAAAAALTAYDPPTKTELDSGLAALNDVSTAEVQTAAAAALTAYDPPTNAEMEARTLAAASYATAANQAAIEADTQDIQTKANAIHAKLPSDSYFMGTSNSDGRPDGVVEATAVTGTLSITQATTNLTEATNDHYNGRALVFITGNLAGQGTDITDYDGTTKILTFTALTEAPANGDVFRIV